MSTRLAQNLKKLREAQGFSQASLAEDSGVPRPTIAHLESGQANPTLNVVVRVARSLGVSVDGLVDPGEVGIRVLGPRNLPSKKSARVRRTQVVPPSTFREAEVERIQLRPGGRFGLEVRAGAVEVLIGESGVFQLASAEEEHELGEEHVAFVRVHCEVSSADGGVLYRVAGA